MIAALRLLSLLLALAVWQGVAQLLGPDIIPTPQQTAVAAREMLASGELQLALSQSLAVYATGFAFAALFGVVAGVVLGGLPLLGRVLDPYAYALAATPRVAFVPLIIVLLGLGFDAKVTIVFLGAAMPILLNTYVGVSNTDPELIEMAKSTGAARFRTFIDIHLPASVPAIVGGLRLGATIGLINTVVAELYTAVQGLGGLLALYGNTFRMAQYFVVILMLAGIGVLVSELLRWVERTVTGWRFIDQ